MQRAFVVVASGLLTAAVGCNPAAPVIPANGPPTPIPPAPAVAPPPAVVPTVRPLSADRLAGKTFIYNHSLLDGNLDGPAVRLAADGKLTGAGEQTAWQVDDGVLVFLDDNRAVRSRFDKTYSGPAGLFFLGHRTGDNKYHTLLELPPTK